MPTISAGALKRMLGLPANVVTGVPRIEKDPRGGGVVIVPVRPYAVLLQCLLGGFGSVFPQCGLMVFPGAVIVSR